MSIYNYLEKTLLNIERYCVGIIKTEGKWLSTIVIIRGKKIISYKEIMFIM